jgi:tRNA 5-methylaminomethyl-2-thiouridine biosynthesis bifunctional protein
LPVIGAIPDPEALKAANKVADIRTFVHGLYYCTAFGSRGATHARLCAEQVVSGILNEPAALELKQQAMLSPARFHLRDRRD